MLGCGTARTLRSGQEDRIQAWKWAPTSPTSQGVTSPWLGRTKPVLPTGATVLRSSSSTRSRLTPTLARFCRWVRDAGFRVYAPILFGSPDAGNAEKPTLGRIPIAMRVARVQAACGQRSSPVTEWLRTLARLAHQECGGRGVAAIGMCLTGGFARHMALDPVGARAGASPAGLAGDQARRHRYSPADLARVQIGAHSRWPETAQLSVRRRHVAGHRVSRPAHRLRRRVCWHRTAGQRRQPRRHDGAGKGAAFRLDRDPRDAPGQPTRRAVDEVIAFFRKALLELCATRVSQ